MRRGRGVFCAAVFLTLAAACGGGSERERADARAAAEGFARAVSEGDWAAFLDLQLPEVREDFLRQLRDNEERLESLVREDGEAAADAVLRREAGMSLADWRGLDERERFARVFAPRARDELLRLGINPDHLRGARLRSLEVAGGEARALFDDGRGHRTRLAFERVRGDGFRYRPPEPP